MLAVKLPICSGLDFVVAVAHIDGCGDEASTDHNADPQIGAGEQPQLLINVDGRFKPFTAHVRGRRQGGEAEVVSNTIADNR